MSELIDNRRKRKDLLKHMIQQLHRGQAPEEVRGQLSRMLGTVPYDDVVEVEQELINEGLPAEEVLKLCDIHTAALRGHISGDRQDEIPPGHPIHTFKKENEALKWELQQLDKLLESLDGLSDDASLTDLMGQIRSRVHALTDVDKHYKRKEELLFPFLEKHEITGPPQVMWGKHDEVREVLKSAVEGLNAWREMDVDEARSFADLVLKPVAMAIDEMIYKEEEILFPMCLKTLTEKEWYEIYQGSLDIGFCLYDPTDQWQPEEAMAEAAARDESHLGDKRVRLPSGAMTPEELTQVLNTIPFDLTFVDADDIVRYFTQGRERIFSRTRAILGRKVQMCHPAKSTHIVQQILDDFRSGRQSQAPFWIQMKGRFIHIEYFAIRSDEGDYLGCLEVSQDLTEKRALTGEQRLLSYADEGDSEAGR